MNSNSKWIGQDGTAYIIKHMRTSHIQNCLNMMKQNPGWRQEYKRVLERELELRQSKLGQVLA